MFRKSSNVKAPSSLSENTSQILLLKGFSCQETEMERYCRCSSCLLSLDFQLCMLVTQEKVLFLAHNKSFSDQTEIKMAGYWTRLQFLLKVLIDFDSVSVHKKGKTNKQTKKQQQKNLGRCSAFCDLTLGQYINNAYIYFMFPRLSGCKDLIRQIYQAVLK